MGRIATTTVFWAGAAIIVLMLGREVARADEAPWCAIKSEGYWDCQFSSAEDCVPLGGHFCTQNPRYRGAQQPRRPQWSSSRHRRR